MCYERKSLTEREKHAIAAEAKSIVIHDRGAAASNMRVLINLPHVDFFAS